MTLSNLAKTRYTTKAFNPDRKIPQATIDELLTLLRHSPSSVNSQPWHFVVAANSEGRARIAKSMHEGYAYNASKVADASHVIVLCSRTSITEQHLDDVLEQEERDGRFAVPDAKAGQRNGRLGYVNLHRHDQKDLQHWMEKQVYLALGTILLGAASMGVDATPMEGFDARKLDEELGLRAQGYTSVVLVGLGYRSETDFNAKLPKSRLPAEALFSYL